MITKDQRKRETGVVFDGDRVLAALTVGGAMAACTATQTHLMP